MGIESFFACNMQKNKALQAEGEKRFRMQWQPIMSEVSHAQRLPRQRLSANQQCAFPDLNSAKTCIGLISSDEQ
jgi:hypothetical protein